MRIDERRPNLVAGDAALVQAEGRTRLGDEVGDNVTRLPAPSLDVRGPLACANIARPGTVARPDKAAVRRAPR